MLYHFFKALRGIELVKVVFRDVNMLVQGV
jgi:hypothetical protein